MGVGGGNSFSPMVRGIFLNRKTYKKWGLPCKIVFPVSKNIEAEEVRCGMSYIERGKQRKMCVHAWYVW